MENLKKDSLIYALDQLEDLQTDLDANPCSSYVLDIYYDDLHNLLFNQNYYIIGTWKARQWLGDNLLNVIGYIKDYEKNYFDFMEDSTDFSSSESIANMITYIFGEEIFSESKIFQCLGGRLYSRLTKFTLDLLIRELKLKLNS